MSIAKQKLYFFKDNSLFLEADVSTSRNKPSCLEGSLGTPLGLHIIDGKIGEGETFDTVFRARKPSGKLHEQTDEEKLKNLILGRIMRLRGLEKGKNLGENVDTFNRYVYIHGTNQEDKIGTPNSHGCVLMASKDLKILFEEIDDKSIVLIEI